MNRVIVSAIALTLVAGSIMINSGAATTKGKVYRYILTESTGPTSLDPLDADGTNNLPVARMIYATPLEISEENQLTSQLLESFRYDVGSKTVEWVVKPNLKYDDGSPLTADDIAFSVSRMAFTRPRFPVLEHIDGLTEWVKSMGALKALPSGIKVNGQKISITFRKDIDHPLFRFCLELFSVIPKKCVDPTTNKITCATIPASGRYRIEERTKDTFLFSKRGNGGQGSVAKLPEKIRFEYIRPEEVIGRASEMDGLTVFAGNESMYSVSDMKSIEDSFSVRFTPASRFAVLQLNQSVRPFQDRACRRYFAMKFREAYQEAVGPTRSVEASVFTKILPGYLASKDLEAQNQWASNEIERCKEVLAKEKIRWGYPESEKDSVFVSVLRRTLRTIGNDHSEPTVTTTRKELSDLFVDRKIDLFNGSTGFWALDPAGDLKMLFTPNLHKPLQHVSEDAELQKMISELETDPSSYARVNRYLYKEARFNVYTHLRRFFASPNKKLVADVPIAITSPAPWQVFRVDM